MAVTINLQSVITWVQTILRQQPLNVTNMEPGLTFGNIILQRILGPPMRRRFNRNNVSWTISNAGGTDYSVAIATLLWPEVYWLVDGGGTVQPLEGKLALPKTATVDRPSQVAPQYDDNAGNITMRLIRYRTPITRHSWIFSRRQNSSRATGSTFGPVPDEFSYIFQKLYLSVAGQLVGDPRGRRGRRKASPRCSVPRPGLPCRRSRFSSQSGTGS